MIYSDWMLCVFQHHFLQLEHDSLSKQRQCLMPRSHPVSFTVKLAPHLLLGKSPVNTNMSAFQL